VPVLMPKLILIMINHSRHKRGKVAVGLSGGVDSSVAASLLKEKGFEVVGIIMEIFDGALELTASEKHSCYDPGEKEDIESAASVCKMLGIPFHTIDLRIEYRKEVIDYFRHQYLEGRTPNPCIVCNQRLKFGFLIEKAKKAGIDFEFFATGHYAKVVKSGDRFLLKRSTDSEKDQTYFLYALTPDQLSRTLFPLGDYTKHQVRAMARDMGLKNADRPESQDFIAGRDYAVLFEKEEIQKGEIVDDSGTVLGTHKGIVHYTVGQRRGLGIPASQPLYVTKIDAEKNRIVVGSKEKLLAGGLIAGDLNFLSIQQLDRPITATVKIRLNHAGVEATISPNKNGSAKIEFLKPQEGVCPGQSAVFYSSDTVIGGGIIIKAL